MAINVSSNFSEIPSSKVNGTELKIEGSFDPKFHPILLVISLLIITANVQVIVLFVKKQNLRQAGKLLLFSLAVSDLTTGLITIPLNIACEFTFSLPVCMASGLLNRFLSISTIFHILAITLETYYAILQPMKHRVNIERRKVLGIACGIWFMALVASLMPSFWVQGAVKNVRSKPSTEFLRKQRIYEIVVFSVGFLMPLTIMVFAHARMFCKILDAVKMMRRRSLPLRQPSIVSKYKTALLFAVILLIFTVTWSFWFVTGILNALDISTHPFPMWAQDCTTILRYTTSFINPLLYTFFRPDIHKAFKSLLKKTETQRKQSLTVTYLLSGTKTKRDSQSNSMSTKETSLNVALCSNSAINSQRLGDNTRV